MPQHSRDTPDFEKILQDHFGYPAFRPGQKAIIQSVWDGKDTLALLPTGGGKSICYQVPALAGRGTCLVVTALIALMKDQVRHLRRRNIPAIAVYSGMSYTEVKKVFENTCDGHYKFLFVSPERLQTSLFREFLPGMDVSLLVVDEAHCISQWGYDFRPPYLQIADLRPELAREVPVLALTASATPDVQQDIMDKLAFRPGGTVLKNSFARPNLSFSVFEEPDKVNKLFEILKGVPGSGLVYCRNRRKTAEIAHLLQLQGIPASHYHAGLDMETRSKRQDAWIRNETRVMVCTNAFGMGIDKPDVRTVVHVDVPDSLEAYYQEAGRAGRDGKRSFAVMLYNARDREQLEALPDQKFMPQQSIREIYQAIGNYLQIARGQGEGQYFAFDFQEFCTRFDKNAQSTLYALQALQAADYLSFNDQVFLPSRVQVTARRETMAQIEKLHPELDDLMKMLLRSYEGMLDYPVKINEKVLAKHMNRPEEVVTERLKKLAGYQLITYEMKTDSPQIFYTTARVSAQELVIENDFYRERKKIYTRQIMEVIRYLGEKRECRSSIIREYFGDSVTAPCGICDNCLQQKREAVPDENITGAAAEILDKISGIHSALLLRKLFLHLPKQVFEKSIRFLLEEEKIEQLPDGSFRKTVKENN